MASTGFACRKHNMNLQTGAERIGCVDAIPSKDLTAPVKFIRVRCKMEGPLSVRPLDLFLHMRIH